ncbi:dihydroorotase [Sulfurimonas lithotrophica]|uniref:Dihydroorotase n=1 Tax=Sulfurimonas lithotrophica TaxID=2590022 RepID=A0A5P8P0N8_9BACT|nr:dihydroorotase [Sulfurimonas lithotrophica]QFR49147.1 dihydroorotase [Sulfurimonas lithotrophica]
MVIKNAMICDDEGLREGNFTIEDRTDNIIDANGAYLIPALVDLNVRLNDGVLNSQNIQAVSLEAKKGGVGHIVLNADSTPSIDNEGILEFAQNGLRDAEGSNVDVMLNALQNDGSLSNIAILLKKGAISPYMSTIAKNDVAIKIAEYIQMYGNTLFVKAEDNSLISSGVMLESDVSSRLGLAGIPDLSEVLHVSRMIEIARHFKIKILFKSIASPRSISLITQAKKEGVEVSCEVSLHHLINSDEACEGFNTVAKLDPPLTSKSDVVLLQDALKNGQIDILTMLHQPSSPVNKEVAFYDAAYGCESIADALPLYYTKLVKTGLISMEKLVELVSLNPGNVVGTKKSYILFNPEVESTIDNTQSLYNGENVFGEVINL